jgi:hypothetical protein
MIILDRDRDRELVLVFVLLLVLLRELGIAFHARGRSP